ncbi:MAG: NUDIX hydrolase [Deltaproteobacteria bacterium]|nr:NUDIX hydrolase [Deltaproteobacteria bacterium]
MLVRDGRAGVEVFLMERSHVGIFGGLHVFPGGKVDLADHAEGWAARACGPDDVGANRLLGVEAGGFGFWVACIRECFEEAGVLLATDESDEPVGFHSAEIRKRFGVWRDRLNAGEAGVFEEMCAGERLRLATDQLAYVSHWITPVDQPKRYDTRFFVARAPSEQEALHDGYETVESAWIRPEVALARFAAGKLNMISPTLKNLESIVSYATTEALIEAKRRVDPSTIPTILPRIVRSTSQPSDSNLFEELLEVVGYGGRLSEC